jgi:mannose/fructose/N-acetylgalactosamine-specific phosphotransferase system component IIB
MQMISRSKIAEERKTDSLEPLFKEEIILDLSIDALTCQLMAKKTTGAKSKNWLEMEKRLRDVIDYINKIHSKAKREFLINELKPSEVITLLDKNKRLERLNLSLMKQNENLKTQIDNYVARFGL